MSNSSVRLSVAHLSKAYAVPVLKNLNFSLHAGEVFGLVGENGAGKSTLINILCGLVEKDSGTLALNAKPYKPINVADAMLQGVSFASQELSLIDELSVAQNISLRKLPNTRGKINTSEVNKKAKSLLAKFGLEALDPQTKVSSLSLAQKQLIELCKALSEDCQLLILDEPTAALSQQQSDTLHTIIQSLAQTGVSIVYVSHRLQDILDQCHRVAVLRDGELVNTFKGNNGSLVLDTSLTHTNIEGLISAMSKGALAPNYNMHLPVHNNDQKQRGAKVLEMRNCTTSALTTPINLSLYAGEIVGIAGLAGAGRTEVLEAIYGLSPLDSGQVLRFKHTSNNELNKAETAEAEVVKNTAHATQLNIGMLSEDRKQQGIFAQQSLAFNASIADLASANAQSSIIKTLSFSNIQSRCRELFSSLAVKHDKQSQSIESLSGGNQQKVLLARWLFAKSQIFLLDEPSRGVDVATKSLIYSQLRQLKAKGASIVVVSSELEELFNVCDRIIVMSNQQIAGELGPEHFSNEAALSLAFSQTADPMQKAI